MTEEKHRKFSVIIGNPPFQETQESTSDKQIFPYFIDNAYNIGEQVELITPAKFLSNAGKTSRKWNKKMLDDEHLKVLFFEPNSYKVFENTLIEGGVCVTYRDATKKLGPIGTFVANVTLNNILHKVLKTKGFQSFSSVVYSSDSYKLTPKLHNDFPDAQDMLSTGPLYSVTTNIFEKFPTIFTSEKNSNDDVCIIGREGGKRIRKYIKKEYILGCKNFKKYKIFVPKSNGSPSLGSGKETAVNGMPILAAPYVGHTQTFISMGSCNSKFEADSALKYVKGKFARSLLATLKVTQHNPSKTWKNVPMQDFTDKSDIDWTKSIHEIDQQLYKKYNLSDDEIAFIENNVKEME